MVYTENGNMLNFTESYTAIQKVMYLPSVIAKRTQVRKVIPRAKGFIILQFNFK